jgi:hypothetical protein
VKEIDRFVRLQNRLLEASTSPDSPLGRAGSVKPSRRVGVVLRQLLMLGVDLRAELPDPEGFLDAVASTATQVALLVAPKGWDAEQAIERLAGLQKQRLIPQIHPGRPSWRRFGPEIHLMRAFWQLPGLGLEVMLGSFRDGLLDEHAADLANYLLFTACTSGAWELSARQRVPDPWNPPEPAGADPHPDPDFPSPDFPGAGNHERRMSMTRQPKDNLPGASARKPLPVLSEKALRRIQGGLGRLVKTAAHGDEAGSSSGTFI